jgi:hypothetical protein
LPNSHEEWETISNGFRNRWNFPLCCGAIDEKHVLINAPEEGSEYYNYKGFNSVVLMAVADYKYCVSYFEVGGKKVQNPMEGISKTAHFWNFWRMDCFPLEASLLRTMHSHLNPTSCKQIKTITGLSRKKRAFLTID